MYHYYDSKGKIANPDVLKKTFKVSLLLSQLLGTLCVCVCVWCVCVTAPQISDKRMMWMLLRARARMGDWTSIKELATSTVSLSLYLSLLC
jgi:hypothetical protein